MRTTHALVFAFATVLAALAPASAQPAERVEKLITDRAQVGLADQSCNVEDAIRKLENALRTA